MKNKGVIITIILILVLGIGITVETRQFVKEKGGGSAISMGPLSENDMMAGESLPLSAGSIAGSERPGEEAAPLEEEAAGRSGGRKLPAQSPALVSEDGEQTQIEEGSAPTEAAAPYSAASSQENGEAASDVPAVAMESMELSDSAADGSEHTESPAAKQRTADVSAAESSVAVSPLAAPAGQISLIEVLTREEYAKRLAEVDSLIENTKETNVNANTDSLKNIADYEYRLWDAELNHIYQAVMSGMDEEESKSLRGEEREWIRRRDSDAKKAASKYKGGTMENLEYTASLAASTRSRAYEILEDYGKYLPE